uniref:Chemokine interleukin-8-like domain-containing protein n=1 Tax=Taeniopygia guttata TaxID=59729 RepID=A0A674HKE0_TAEGU
MGTATRVVCALLILATLCWHSLAQRAPAVPDKCCFNFQTRRIKRDNVVACYPTSPECPHQAVITQLQSPLLLQGNVLPSENPRVQDPGLPGNAFHLHLQSCSCAAAEGDGLCGPREEMVPGVPEEAEEAKQHLHVKLPSPNLYLIVPHHSLRVLVSLID